MHSTFNNSIEILPDFGRNFTSTTVYQNRALFLVILNNIILVNSAVVDH